MDTQEREKTAAGWRCPYCDALNDWQDAVCQICGDGRRDAVNKEGKESAGAGQQQEYGHAEKAAGSPAGAAATAAHGTQAAGTATAAHGTQAAGAATAAYGTQAAEAATAAYRAEAAAAPEPETAKMADRGTAYAESAAYAKKGPDRRWLIFWYGFYLLWYGIPVYRSYSPVLRNPQILLSVFIRDLPKWSGSILLLTVGFMAACLYAKRTDRFPANIFRITSAGFTLLYVGYAVYIYYYSVINGLEGIAAAVNITQKTVFGVAFWGIIWTLVSKKEWAQKIYEKRLPIFYGIYAVWFFTCWYSQILGGIEMFRKGRIYGLNMQYILLEILIICAVFLSAGYMPGKTKIRRMLLIVLNVLYILMRINLLWYSYSHKVYPLWQTCWLAVELILIFIILWKLIRESKRRDA